MKIASIAAVLASVFVLAACADCNGSCGASAPVITKEGIAIK